MHLLQAVVLSILLYFLLLRVELYHYSILNFALVCLAKVCEHSVLPNVMKEFIISESYFVEVVSKNVNS